MLDDFFEKISWASAESCNSSYFLPEKQLWLLKLHLSILIIFWDVKFWLKVVLGHSVDGLVFAYDQL